MNKTKKVKVDVDYLDLYIKLIKYCDAQKKCEGCRLGTDDSQCEYVEIDLMLQGSSSKEVKGKIQQTIEKING